MVAGMNSLEAKALPIEGAWQLTPRQHADERGVFLEWFRHEAMADVIGRPFELRQANLSVSSAGTLRGIHYADVPPGQAKYVTCVSGAVCDVVVDIRVGSPTFGSWTSVILDDIDRRAVYIGEGLGHAFMALADDTVVAYMCTDVYRPANEHGVNPLDPALAITWPATGRNGHELQITTSEKDAAAPTLAAAQASGALPNYAAPG